MHGQPIRILLVDDSADFLESATRFLSSKAGIVVVGQAASGADVLAAVQTLRPDVVLMDVAMAGVSGLEATRQIKALADPPRVLLVSMYDSADLRALAEAVGADGFVGKWEFAASVLAAVLSAAPAPRTRASNPQAARLRSLAHLNQLVSAPLDTDEVQGTVVRAATQLLNVRLAGFWQADDATESLIVGAWSDQAVGAQCPLTRVRYSDGALGWVATRRRGLHIADIATDSRHLATAWARGHGLASFLGLPVMLDGTLRGVLALWDPHPFGLDPEGHDILDAFCTQAAVALRNAQRHAEVRGQRDLLRALIETSADAILATDADGRLTYVSARAESMLGCSASSLLGQDLRQVYAKVSTQPQDVRALEAQLADGAEVWHHDATIRRHDGQVVHTSTVLATRRDAAGQVTDRVAVIRDVTELRQAQRAVQESERLAFMGSLLAGVAHELNNPLQVIRGQAELVLRDKARRYPPPTVRAEAILKAAKRASRIVDNFLALARRRPSVRQLTALNEVVLEALELLEDQLRDNAIEVRLVLDRELPEVWGDPDELHQVVVNLVSNARQALRDCAPPRRIRLATHYDQETARIVLEVEDSGPGVPLEIRERIFEPLFTTKPQGEGTGLGLALCHGIIQAHGGTLRLLDTPLPGAVFTLTLPAALPHERRPVSLEPPSPPRPPRQRILVADSEPEIAELAADMLGADGHDAEIQTRGGQVLEQLQASPFDLIVFNIGMPGLSGIELYQTLQLVAPAMARRLIFTLDDAPTQEISDFLEREGIPHLVKPFSFLALRAAVARALGIAEP
jgi:two-component system NtrC family sensor kinase